MALHSYFKACASTKGDHRQQLHPFARLPFTKALIQPHCTRASCRLTSAWQLLPPCSVRYERGVGHSRLWPHAAQLCADAARRHSLPRRWAWLWRWPPIMKTSAASLPLARLRPHNPRTRPLQPLASLSVQVSSGTGGTHLRSYRGWLLQQVWTTSRHLSRQGQTLLLLHGLLSGQGRLISATKSRSPVEWIQVCESLCSRRAHERNNAHGGWAWRVCVVGAASRGHLVPSALKRRAGSVAERMLWILKILLLLHGAQSWAFFACRTCSRSGLVCACRESAAVAVFRFFMLYPFQVCPAKGPSSSKKVGAG